MRIAILGCDAIRDEIEQVTKDDPDIVYREYLDFGLHIYTDELLKRIQERLATMEGQYDAVFLGYGHCQTLKGMPEKVNVPLVMLEYEDCIAAMLPDDEYHREKKSGGITWFYPSGWARNGPDGLIKLFKLDSMRDQGYEPLFFLKMMFEGFTRVLFIDTGAGDTASNEVRSQELACMLCMKHERREGTVKAIGDAIVRTKELARKEIASRTKQ
ncbi:MAG TPA: DUF1638 domain-containing protein [Methanomassiliicoccales archaeon]